MASVYPSSSKSPFIEAPKQIILSSKLSDYWDAEKIRDFYQKGNFVGPLLYFMKTAAQSTLSFDKQRKWVLELHQIGCTQSLTQNPALQAIAFASGESLFDVLYDIFKDPSDSYCFDLVYDPTVQQGPKVSPQSKAGVVDRSKQIYAENLKTGNPIPFFAHVFKVSSQTATWSQHSQEIYTEITTQALSNLFPNIPNLNLNAPADVQPLSSLDPILISESPSELDVADVQQSLLMPLASAEPVSFFDLYKALAPLVFDALSAAQNRTLYLYRDETGKSCCSCIIL